jgi:hypothetical protein
MEYARVARKNLNLAVTVNLAPTSTIVLLSALPEHESPRSNFNLISNYEPALVRKNQNMLIV